MIEPGKNASKTRGRPFEAGNPGRPKGSRHKITLAVEALLDGEAETLTRKAIEMGKEGDLMALRLCLERICPPRKDRPVPFSAPTIRTAGDAVQAVAAIVQAVAAGDLTPVEAGDLTKVVESYARILEAADHEERLRRLEASLNGGKL